MSKPKIIIIPGNGDSNIKTDHWYSWVSDLLNSEYHGYIDLDHFGTDGQTVKQFPEVIEVIQRKLER